MRACVRVCVCVWVTLLYKRNEYNIANQPYLRNHKSTIKLKEKKKRWLPPQEEQLLYFSSFDCPKIIDQKEAQLFSYWISQERNNLFEGHVLSLSSHKLFRKGLNFLSCDLWFSKSSKNKYSFINNNSNNDILISGGTKESKSQFRDFPGSPLVKTSPSNARSTGPISGQEARVPLPCSQRTKT